MDNSQEQPLIKSHILELYEQIENLAMRQVELLASSQLMEEIISPLVDLTDQRQHCMDEIDKLTETLGDELPVAEKAATADIIQRILSLDKESQLRLQDISEATGRKLIKVQDMKKANRAYSGQDEPAEAWFFDRKR